MTDITLAQALAEDRLPEFIEQAEAAGVGTADQSAFEKAIEALVKAPQPEGRT